MAARSAVAAPVTGRRVARDPWPIARRLLGRGLLHALALGLGTLLMVPFAWAVISSLKAVEEIRVLPPVFWPSRFMWSNYLDVWRSTLFAR